MNKKCDYVKNGSVLSDPKTWDQKIIKHLRKSCKKLMENCYWKC